MEPNFFEDANAKTIDELMYGVEENASAHASGQRILWLMAETSKVCWTLLIITQLSQNVASCYRNVRQRALVCGKKNEG